MFLAPTIRTAVQNIPPLISTQQPTILNIQSNRVNAQTVSLQPNTSTPTSISYITTNQSNLNQINQWRSNQMDDNKPIMTTQAFQNVQEQQPQVCACVVLMNVKTKQMCSSHFNQIICCQTVFASCYVTECERENDYFG